MKKRILAIVSLLIIITAAGLVACGQKKIEKVETVQAAEYSETIHTRSMFVEVEETYEWKVVYQEDTKVMYSVSADGVFTLLVNQDGTPMIWEG